MWAATRHPGGRRGRRPARSAGRRPAPRATDHRGRRTRPPRCTEGSTPGRGGTPWGRPHHGRPHQRTGSGESVCTSEPFSLSSRRRSSEQKFLGDSRMPRGQERQRERKAPSSGRRSLPDRRPATSETVPHDDAGTAIRPPHPRACLRGCPIGKPGRPLSGQGWESTTTGRRQRREPRSPWTESRRERISKSRP